MRFARRTLLKIGSMMIVSACALETDPTEIEQITERESDGETSVSNEGGGGGAY